MKEHRKKEPTPMRRVTVKDLAKLSGFSQPTVSRALNNSPLISPETKKKIIELAERLNYRPNTAARALVQQKTRIIGFVMQTFEHALHPVMAQLLQGVSREVSKYNYNLLLLSPHQATGEFNFAEVTGQKYVDGLLVPTQETKPKDIIRLEDEKIPFVLINNYIPGVAYPCVRVDYQDIGFKITQHLCELGHGRIALLNGPADFRISIEMLEGYRLALTLRDLPFLPELVRNGYYTEAEGYRLMQELLRLPEPPTAVWGEDYMVVGAMRALKEANVKIPAEMAVVGLNDVPLVSSLSPPLTSMQIPMLELGQRAAQKLIAFLESGQPLAGEEVLKGKLIIRESCGAKQVLNQTGT